MICEWLVEQMVLMMERNPIEFFFHVLSMVSLPKLSLLFNVFTAYLLYNFTGGRENNMFGALLSALSARKE